MIRQIVSAIILSLVFIFLHCKRGLSEDIQDCNPIADYYEKGTHYIRRDLVTDDNTLDYKKLFEDTKPQASECYPANHEVK